MGRSSSRLQCCRWLQLMTIIPTKIAMAVPQISTDKILFADQFSHTFAGSGSQTLSISSGLPTGDGFVFGAFSTDTGATFQDFGSYAFSSKFTITPSVTGTATYRRNDGSVRFQFNLPTSGLTLLIQCAVAVPTASNMHLTQPASTSGKLLYRGSGNFQKLYLEGSFTQPNGAAQTTTIAHSLGYVPQVRVFSDQGSSDIQMINTVGSEVIKVDETNLKFALGAWAGTTRTLYYRIYY